MRIFRKKRGHRRTYISRDGPNPPTHHTPLEQRISRLRYLRRTRMPRHRPAQEHRLHEAKAIVAQDAPW